MRHPLIGNGQELAGAGLDVFEHEPTVNPKLARLARDGKVVLLPHMGSATLEGRIDMGEKVIINIKTFMDGHRPPDRVLPSTPERMSRKMPAPHLMRVAAGFPIRTCASRKSAAHPDRLGCAHGPFIGRKGGRTYGSRVLTN